MQLLDAAYNCVHDYPGGAPSLAPRLGKSVHTLNHELTASGTAKLGLVDACRISHFTGDMRILHAFAEELGHMCIRLPAVDGAAGGNVMQALAASSKEFAELCQEVCSSMADNQVSDNELARIERARGELLAQLAQLGEFTRQHNQAHKPAWEKGGAA
jgi:hypothetical protein